MSLKNLFKNQESFKFSSLKSSDEAAREIEESGKYIEAYTEDRDRFIPPVDYSKPSNFARYGLAEKYYEDAVKRIYQTYPYDGSRREVVEWHNSSSYIDKYIFENEYPRTNGYALFSADGWGDRSGQVVESYGTPSSLEYIHIKGGPHTGSNMSVLKTGFSASNIYDEETNRQSNLEYNLDRGTTVEFWLKKESFTTSNTAKEVVFDLWNGESSASVRYGRLTIELTGASGVSPFVITALSGTSGFQHSSIGTDLTTTSLATWGHYAFTFVTGPSSVSASLYVNGKLNQSVQLGSAAVNEVTGAMRAFIGGLITPPSGVEFASIPTGSGKLSASMDEFRYWKTKRTSQQIGRNWFTNIYGGTNTDDHKYNDRNPVNLGVYYKFNEGITGRANTDSVVLDYSGRVSNGSWVGYDVYSRNVGSAIVSGSAAKKEFRDPIIYSFHPDVEAYLDSKKNEGLAHDVKNNASLYNMLPRWVIDEDTKEGGQIRNLTQILSSYFDTLHLQIHSLSTLREATYSTYSSASISSSAKPLPFANRLLEGMGLSTPELFIDANIIEKIASRDERREYEENLHDVKNLIYHNIYNNLAYIYKSKGTEKAFRNLVRCFGIDDELVKFNIYGQNALFELKNNFRSTVVRKSVIDFNHPTRTKAVVYQYPSGSERGYITARESVNDMPVTVEAEIIFPRKKTQDEQGYFHTDFFQSSLFGVHGVKNTTSEGTDTTWTLSDTFTDSANFQVYAIRTSSFDHDYDTRDAYFRLTSSSPFPIPKLDSNVYQDVYDDSKWNFAVRLVHDEYKQNNFVLGTSGSSRAYKVEFYGVNMILDEVMNEFVVSASVDTEKAEAFLAARKRLYVGAHRTNFTGTLLQHSDVKASSLRYWFNYVSNNEVKAHARDVTNLGLEHPYRHLSLFHTGANKVYIPSFASLALNWDFETVTGSNAAGQFDVRDFSSGSAGSLDRYGVISKITKRKHPGRGDFFVASTTASIDKNYYHVAKQQLPEYIYSNDMVNLVDEDDVTFTRESRPTQFFFSAEKSMYQTISEEMVNFFATIVDFNNLIGEPVNKYRHEYKDLKKLRQLYFERIENVPDLDRYVDFYKWIDNSITQILAQLMPASANVSENVRTMVEDHILTRNKYRNKFPTFKDRKSTDNLLAKPGTPAEFPLYGDKRDEITRRQFRRIANAPRDRVATFSTAYKNIREGRTNPPNQSVNSAWWKYRASRSHPTITSGDSAVDRDRDKILSASSPFLDSFSSRGRSYAISFDGAQTIDGGVNFANNKRIRYAHQATTEFGPTTTFTIGEFGITASNNFVVFFEKDIDKFFDTNDEIVPPELDKKKWRFTAFNNSERVEDSDGSTSTREYNTLKGDIAVPFNLYNHNQVISGGYHDLINLQFSNRGIDFTNIHVDTYGPDNNIPMQGPFTRTHVGGLQSRHVELNKYDPAKTTTKNNLDDDTTRPEAWFLFMGALDEKDNAVGIVGPTYTTTGEYDKDTPRARHYRGLKVKSPVNIRNIRTSGSILGNYSSSIEYVMTTGRLENNAYFKQNEGVTLPQRHAVKLPATTNVHTLLGVSASLDKGNIFGPSNVKLGLITNRVASDTQYSLPLLDETGSDSVIVNRFSAPGGPEVMSRGYLDIVAEERSVYNALPYRNLSVRGSGSGEPDAIRADIIEGVGRDGLRTLLTRHCGQFGIDNEKGTVQLDNYSTVPSFHKIHRNTIKRIEYSNEFTGDPGTTATASFHNNYWLQTPIPSSELQYSWFTASFESFASLAEVYGYAPASGFVESPSQGIIPAFNFVEQSHVTNSVGIKTPFTAHNTIVIDGVLSSQNLLSAAFPSGYVTDLGAIDTKEGIATIANAVSLLRHGPYQWPSWRQIRNNEHQIARYQRKNNILSITSTPDKIFTKGDKALIAAMKAGSLTQFTEGPITSKYQPIIHILTTENRTNPFSDSDLDTKRPLSQGGFKYTYSNDKDMFATDEINFVLKLNNTSRNLYDDLTDLYIDAAKESEVSNFNLLSYRETVFPQPENAFLLKTRSRPTFIYPEWKKKRDDRKVTNRNNSMGLPVPNSSIWPLDARDNFATATPTTPGTGSGTGELQNLYTIFHDDQNVGQAVASTKSVRFTQRSFLTASAAHSSGALNRDYLAATTISMWFKTDIAHLGGGTGGAVSSSMIIKGAKDEAPAYEIRFHGRGITANVGSDPGSGVGEISAGDVHDNGLAENFADNTWRNVVLTWQTSQMRLYVTGVLAGTATPGTSPATGSNLVIFGGKPSGSSDHANNPGRAKLGYHGFLDEISFFSGTMTADQITTLYNSGNPIDVPNTSFSDVALISHYRMGEDAEDGPLGTVTGFIKDVAHGVSGPASLNVTGNLSASVSNTKRSGFATVGYGIIADAPYNPNAGGNVNLVGPVYNRQVPLRDSRGSETAGVFVGDTLYETAIQAGKEPFYNSYDDYREEFRSFAKDYSTIPEFRMSEHMKYYVETNAGNFLANNPYFLELTGATSNTTSSAEDGFYQTYTNSDFLKFFDIVKQEHSEVGYDPSKLILKCNAVVKFTPYDGFYPASRTLQLATLFSESFAENLAHRQDSAVAAAGSFGAQVSFRTFLAPMFAPGVLYNSIKSGLAVDYPIMTSSFTVSTPDFNVATDTTSSFSISSSFGYRVPFEALAEPEAFLAGVTFVDQEPHPKAAIDSTSSWDGSGSPLFEAGMNNFIAEVPRFFLRNTGVTSLVSARDNDKKYFKAEFGKEYKMRVVLRNSKTAKRRQLENLFPRDNSGGQQISLTGSFFTNPTITMYSRRSAFGPPVAADHVDFLESFEPFTPPYMDGYSDVELTFRPDETRFYFIDEIVSQVTSSFFRVGEQYFDSSPISTARKNQMHITASVNLLDIVKVKKATYDPVTGAPSSVEDDADAPSVALIQTKWECPMLDFADVSVTRPDVGGDQIAKGMWHQYGDEPTVDTGVYLEIQDLTAEELGNASLTGSLADLMGFSKTPVKLGQMLEEKTVREAVVAIPYTTNGEKKIFTKLSREDIQKATQVIAGKQVTNPPSAAVVNMVDSMSRYVFPPKFDYLTNKTINPVAMYIFEFEHTFTKQDLIDMWQNLPPEIGTKFATKSKTVEHSFAMGDLLGDNLPDGLRWMVFKVKQKASYNYFDMLKNSAQEEGFDFQIQKGVTKNKSKLAYSYNWPYDFFSLVELVKMDTEVIIRNTTRPDEPPSNGQGAGQNTNTTPTERDRRRLAAEQAEREAAEAATAPSRGTSGTGGQGY